VKTNTDQMYPAIKTASGVGASAVHTGECVAAETARSGEAALSCATPTDPADDAPAWFTEALAVVPEILDIDRSGLNVRAYRWGDPQGRPLVLLHGAGANAHWWDHIAPLLLAPGLQVVAVDLAGHGNSDYRAEYTLTGWAEDVMAVCAASSRQKPLLIGHSAGGRVAWKAAEHYGRSLCGIVTVDSPLPPPAAQLMRRRTRPDQYRVYADQDEIVRRFRLTPDQPGALPFVLRHVAQRSVLQVEHGWTWAHDVNVYHRRRPEEIVAAPLDCPVFALLAEHGSTDKAAALLIRRLVPRMIVCTIPQAGHHVMLDQPLALIGLLRLITELLISGTTLHAALRGTDDDAIRRA
jgi:pimeloyl-ACP methyl ester carboxylesterase